MLTRLAATLRGRQSLGEGIEGMGGEGGEGATVVLDENCLVRCTYLLSKPDVILCVEWDG